MGARRTGAVDTVAFDACGYDDPSLLAALAGGSKRVLRCTGALSLVPR